MKAKKQFKGTAQRRELLPPVPENPFVQEKKQKQTNQRKNNIQHGGRIIHFFKFCCSPYLLEAIIQHETKKECRLVPHQYVLYGYGVFAYEENLK